MQTLLYNSLSELGALAETKTSFSKTRLSASADALFCDQDDLLQAEGIKRSRTSLVELVEEQARLHPNGNALSNAELDIHMSYADLVLRANKLAAYLDTEFSTGVGRDKLIALRLGRSFRLIEWILAVLMTGTAFLYIDPEHPLERQKFILQDCHAGVLISDIGLGASGVGALTSAISITLIEENQSQHERLIAEYPEPSNDKRISMQKKWRKSLSPESLAYSIYTSGSTGHPKGVLIEHRNLTNFGLGLSAVASLPTNSTMGRPCPRVLQLAPFVFDAAIAELFGALIHGGTLCFCEHPKLLVGDYLAKVLTLNRITYLQCTPSIISTISPSELSPTVDLLGLAGESAAGNLIKAWLDVVDVMICYGPSECAVATSSSGRIPRESSWSTTENRIGSPMPHCTLHILEPETMKLVDDGYEGELCIAGMSVGRGYTSTEATAMKFVNHPHLGRLYRSADKVRRFLAA